LEPATYGNPAESAVYAVRFLLQDTGTGSFLLTDSEIEYALSVEAPRTPPTQRELLCAAAYCAEALAFRFAARADVIGGSLRFAAANRAKNWLTVAQRLRERAQGLAAPLLTGATVAEREALEANEALLQPAFRMGEFEEPAARTRPSETERGEGSELLP
jgi:hypothetical protein